MKRKSTVLPEVSRVVQIPLGAADRSMFRGGALPVLIYAGRIGDEPDWSFPHHKHDDLSEIIYICEGEGSFVVDGREYAAGAGDLLIYNRGVMHGERSNPDKPLRTYFCGVGNLAIEGVADGRILPAHRPPVIRTDRYRGKVETYIRNIFEEADTREPGYETVCQHLLISLIALIRRIASAHDTVVTRANRHALGQQIKEYLDRHYAEDIPLSEIAGTFCISPHYLSHIFKEKIGYSPINYIIQLRIGEAKRLLLTTDLPVQSIAHRVGYDNANYFSMLFKKMTGHSPRGFRDGSKPQ